MSRRTKVVLLLLFLVLLGIPVIHVGRTWRSGDVLKVRLDLDMAEEARKRRRDDMVPLPVIIENTGASPVHIKNCWIMTRDHLGRKREAAVVDKRSLKDIWRTVPAHGSVRTYLLPDDFTLAQVDNDVLWVGFRSISGSRGTVFKCVAWVPHCLPESWRRHLPVSTLDESIIALPIPAGTAAFYRVKADSPEGLPPPAPRVDARSP
ncbi:hypothetical protein DES53_11599 [Roseimicrobium gellanilyticum]|uniref:Uncharacterized protein n=1 Tax=Roseimicrobium gellanilyticum TaxID=748857 RepID=A0A366H4W8_9BACT|nr:hypothetical protein [Roseimicrobium gellanilyticum]RBP36958.1 hypothetical protein DES53_11599 [Roseimicrobium gellanilyticum]